MTLPNLEDQGRQVTTSIGAAHIDFPSSRALDFIRTNLPVAPVPGIPEIQLHKAGPSSGLSRLAEAEPDFATPYWAYHWGGGLALARYVLDRPACIAARRVLDLGSGSGLVGIAAMKVGAQSVIAADVDPYAAAAATLNAQANAITLTPVCADLASGEPPSVDVVLAADVFYAEDVAQRIMRFLDRCLAAGIEVFIGDPWRAWLPHPRLRLLAEYPGMDFGGASATNAVFRYLAAT